MKIKRFLSAFVALTSTVIFVILAGIVSNWFRYGLTLQASLALRAWALVLVPLAAVAVFTAFRKSISWTVIISLVAYGAVAGTLAFRYTQRVQSPGMFNVQLNHIDGNDWQSLDDQSGTVRYRLRLFNPFHRRHKEVLEIEINGQTREVEVPVFDVQRPSNGYIAATKADDWCTLSRCTPAGNCPQGEYLLSVTSFLRKSCFEIDLEAPSAIEVAMEACERP